MYLVSEYLVPGGGSVSEGYGRLVFVQSCFTGLGPLHVHHVRAVLSVSPAKLAILMETCISLDNLEC